MAPQLLDHKCCSCGGVHFEFNPRDQGATAQCWSITMPCSYLSQPLANESRFIFSIDYESALLQPTVIWRNRLYR